MVVLLLSVLVAAAQGFIFEVMALAGAILGFLLAAWSYPLLAPRFLPYAKSQTAAELASFLTILIAVALLAGALARILRWAVKEAGLRWFDRLLGAAFGLVRGVVAVTAVVLALATFDPKSDLLDHSELAGYFLVAAQGAVWVSPAEVRRRFWEGLKAIREAPTAPLNGAQQTTAAGAGAAPVGRKH